MSSSSTLQTTCCPTPHCAQLTVCGPNWPWGSGPHQLQPARLLAQALARLPAVLPTAVSAMQHESIVFSARSTVGDAVAQLFDGCMHAAVLLSLLIVGGNARHEQLLSGAADIPAWCAAACGALRAAPQAAQALHAQHRSESADKALWDMAVLLVTAAGHLAKACVSFAQAQARARWGPTASAAASEPAAAALAAAETALWQLHTAACRVAHFTGACGDPALQSPQLIRRLWDTTAGACHAASWLEAWAIGRVAGDTKP